MTHDELLVIVNKYRDDIISGQVWTTDKFITALRAVVELHNPHEIKDSMIYCEGCSNSAFFPWDSCPTIQAIKKELE